jgi:hypothetical protein
MARITIAGDLTEAEVKEIIMAARMVERRRPTLEMVVVVDSKMKMDTATNMLRAILNESATATGRVN